MLFHLYQYVFSDKKTKKKKNTIVFERFFRRTLDI
jgi:hypothetical protein